MLISDAEFLFGVLQREPKTKKQFAFVKHRFIVALS